MNENPPASPSPAPPPPPNWITRFLDRVGFLLGVVTLSARAVRRCFFGVLALAITLAFFMLAPQGKEILSLVVEDADWSRFWWLCLIVSAATLALIAWYSSRVLLAFHDVFDEKLMTLELIAFSRRLEEWFPRILGALCILPLVFFLADVGVKTYVLNSPLLIVAAFAALAFIDGLNGCLRFLLYRLGFISSIVFVCLSHRWTSEVPYPQDPTLSNLPAALFRIEGHISFATTGVQLAVAIALWLILDYGCTRWKRWHAIVRLHGTQRRNHLIALAVVALVALGAWLITFRTALLPRTAYVVPATLLVAVLVIAFLVHRRAWFAKMISGPPVTKTPSGRDDAPPGSRRATVVHVAKATQIILWVAAVIGTAVFFLVWAKPIEVGRFLGAPTLLMLALSIWVVFGGVVLTVVPNAYRLPSFGLLPLIAAALTSCGDAPITISASATPAANASFTRPDVRTSFNAWVARQDIPKTGPIYLVAAAGGGIRAAFLTASYLAAADDLTQGRFGKHVFAISGVSGGSLGAAMYALAGDGATIATCPEAVKQPAEIGPRQRAMLCALGDDFLSPTVATYLFPDLFRALWLPAFVYRNYQWQDRGRTLEQSWVASVDPARAATLNGRFLDYAAGADPRVEAGGGPRNVNLILNATRVQSGQRVVASTFTWPWLSTIDLFDRAYDTAATSMVGAVHNSARFTYVSPAGAYFHAGSNRGEFSGQVADGGYFDNSGVLSLLEIIAEIEKDGDEELLSRIHVVIITNDGNERWICDDSEPASGATEVQITAPIATFLAARPARAELSKAQLRRVLSRVNGGTDLCGVDGVPIAPLMEVSLNNAFVAAFLRDEAAGRVMIGKCRVGSTSPLPVGTDLDARKRTAQSEKEIAVRVAEAPLGWTLSAATTDWLTRYASLEACKVSAQLGPT
ncbi:MAG: hypothetical protein ABI981_02415 [Betaproteobacteria bacterium]